MNYSYTPLSSEQGAARANELVAFIHKVVLTLGYDWQSISFDKEVILRIIDHVERRREYYRIFHTIELSELREACTYCYWILKYSPFTDNAQPTAKLDVNVKISIHLLFTAANYTASKRGKKINISSDTLTNVFYLFKYRDLSIEAIMALAESLFTNVPFEEVAKSMVPEIAESNTIGSILLVGDNTENIPMWTINYYLQEFCNNYNKIIITLRICELLQKGIHPSNILLAKHSGEVIPHRIDELEDVTELRVLPDDVFRFILNNFKNGIGETEPKDHFFYLSKNQKIFWERLLKEPRPMVFVNSVFSKINLLSPIPDIPDKGTTLLPILNLSSFEAVKVTSFNFNSPVNLEPRGLIGGLIDLAYAHERNERDKEAFISEQIGKSADNVVKIALASHAINNSSIPDGQKKYLQLTLDQILANQAELNKTLGIRVEKLDISV